MTRSAADIANLLARSGLTEGDLLGLVEDTLPPSETGRVLGALAAAPELDAMVWLMRSDREASLAAFAVDREAAGAAPDLDAIDLAVELGVTGDIPAAFAERIESTGVGRSRVHLRRLAEHAQRSAPGRRRLRPGRTGRRGRLGTVLGSVATGAVAFGLGLALLAGLGWAIVIAWPAPPTAPPERLAAADLKQELPAPGQREAFHDSAIAAAGGTGPAAPSAPDAGEDGPWSAGFGTPAGSERIAGAAEALAAAQEGRLMIRVVSADGRAARAMVESITTQPSVSRVAVLEGRMHDVEAERFVAAVPADEPVVYASSRITGRGLESDDEPDRGPRRLASDAYMLEVEPTERGFALLLAGLRRDPGVLVQLVRTGEPVTTPGGAGDAVWFTRPTRDWQPRIAAPVLVESLGAPASGRGD